MKQRVSASGFELARKCQYPWSSGLEWDKRKPKWNAVVGTTAHDAVEHMDKSRIAKTPGLSARQVEVCESIYDKYVSWEDAYCPPKAVREVAFAIDPVSGSVIMDTERRGHRDYSWAPDGHFTCTVDLYYPDWRFSYPDWKFDYIDLKTGWMAKPAEESWQMRFIGACVAGHKKKQSVDCAILVVRERGEPIVWPATFGDMTLDLVRNEMGRVHLAIQSGDGPNPGEHCKYCPVKSQCKECKDE